MAIDKYINDIIDACTHVPSCYQDLGTRGRQAAHQVEVAYGELVAVLSQYVANCPDCDGDGFVYQQFGDQTEWTPTPCGACAPAKRALEGK